MEPRYIRALRGWLGLSQEAFARRLGVSRNAVARWELGMRNPSGPATVLLNQMWDQMKGESAAA